MTEDDATGAMRSRRRSFLRASTATLVSGGAIIGAGAGLRQVLGDGGELAGTLELQGGRIGGVGLLDRRLRDLGLTSESAGSWVTPRMSTSEVSMLGFSWRDGRDSRRQPSISVRLRSQDRWSAWREVALIHDLPDPDSAEGAASRMGTAPLVVKAVDGLQVRVAGRLPRDLTLTLLHSPRTSADERAAVGAGTALGRVEVATPVIHSRAEWGADESWRRGSPTYNTTIAQVHIHHTATSNGYAPGDVPAMIRSMYRYHTHSLGWSDIGYNFLVDSYGTIWEGRYGGVDQPVRGAHTLGFNNASTGFSMIGNYDTAAPTAQMLASASAMAAWKLGMYDGDPLGFVSVTSEGSDKFGPGRVVSLPVIDGHRDTNDTACPGANVYAQLDAIRAQAAGVISAATLRLKTPYAVTGDSFVGGTLSVGGGKFKPLSAVVSYQWLRNSQAIPGAVGSTYTLTDADIAQSIGVIVTGSIAGVVPVQQGVPAPGTIRSIPTMTVRTQRKRGGKAIVHVEVLAPGVAEPDGEVLIKLGPRERTVRVEKGKAIARFVGVDPGRYRVRCKYAGGTFVEPRKARDWIRIPGKGRFARSQ